MFSFKNFSQLALFLQNIESLDLYSDEKSFFVKTELGRAKDGLREMKKAREILESLCADLTSAITDVTARIMPAARHHGLNELPDEILADILVRNTSHEYWTCIRHQGLKLVNKRFRSIVSSTPLCWSTVVIHEQGRNSNMCKNPVIRKGSIPIDCMMSEKASLPTFLQLKDRIRSINWTSLYAENNTGILDDKRDLPSVKTLKLDNDVDEDNFPCGWTFSQLTSLESDGFLPTGPFPHLRHCVLNLVMNYGRDEERLRYWTTETTRDYEAIYKFLESTQSLESLSFPINGNTPLKENDDKPKRISLTKLRRLSLRCSPGKDNFLELLVCPALETLKVELQPFIYDHYWDTMFDNPSLRMRTSFRNVTNLSITGGTSLEGKPSDEKGFLYTARGGLKICLYGIHRAFKRLKRLSIDGDLRIQVDKIKDEDYYGGLKDTLPLISIYLRIPLKNHWDDLESIFEFYKRKNANFKYVEVRDWHRDPFRKNHSAMKSLSSLFPNTNIYVDELKHVTKHS